MGLLGSLFSRKDAAPSGEAPEQARTRARRRLMGAAVLVAAGVIGFPLLFETQPRPVRVDVPIEIPRKDAVAPLPSPAPAPRAAASSAAQGDESATASRTEGAPAAAPSEPVASAAPPAAVAKPASAPVRAAKATPAPAAAAPARPAKPELAEKKAPPAPAAASARMVVQVGAYADTNAARDARQRLDKLGLKSHTQVVDTDGGKRIRVRVGPFTSRDEADRAVDRIRSAGLPAAVMAP